eukprot:2273363-Rhodomonas_salina.3
MSLRLVALPRKNARLRGAMLKLTRHGVWTLGTDSSSVAIQEVAGAGWKGESTLGCSEPESQREGPPAHEHTHSP